MTIRHVRAASTTGFPYTEIVVPVDVSAVTFDYDGAYGVGPTGPANVAAFVDKYITPDLNLIHTPGSAIERKASRLGGRAVIFCLPSSSLLSGAPADLAPLVAALVATVTPESYVIISDPGGDAWIVAKRGEGFRHAAFDLLAQLDVKYFGAHPAWKRVKKLGRSTQLSLRLLRVPTIRDFVQAPNGGIGGGNVGFAGALQDKQFATDQYWWDWFAQNRYPREWNGPGSDGTAGLSYYKQPEFSHDRKMLAWDSIALERGFGGSANGGHFPSICQPISYPFFFKQCTVHHGAVSGGTYPARPGTATPWTTPPNAPSGPSATVGVAFPSPDPNPDADNTPLPSDYTSFGGAVKLLAEHLRDAVAANINTFGPTSPNVRWISVDPNDGPGSCECTKNKDLLRNGPYAAYLTPTQRASDASLSDGVWHSVNTTQAFLDYWFGTSTSAKPGSIMSAYNDHTAVPSIPIAVNSAVYYAISSTGTNMLQSEIAAAWGAKRTSNPFGPFTLGIFPAWLISNANYDMPRLSPRTVASLVKTWVALGYTGLAPQTTVSNFSAGCIYYIVAALCWDTNANVEALIADYFASVFGAAATAIRAMYERFWQWFELAPHEIGQCFRDVQSAQAALSADTSATAEQQTCLDHIAAGVQWLRLFYEYLSAQAAYAATPNGTTLTAYDNAIDAALSWLWNIKPWNVVQADRLAKALWVPIPSSETALIAKWNTANSSGAGWATVAEPTHSALVTAMSAGATAYPLLTGVTRKTFSSTLVRYTTSTDPTIVWMPQCDSPQTYQFIKDAATITFAIKQQGLNSGGRPILPFRILVQDLAGTTVQEISQLAPDPLLGPVTTMHTITVPPGQYLLQVVDLGDNWQQARIGVPRSTPIVLFAQATRFSREFDQSPYPETHLYFYVPLGTTRIACSYNSYEPVQFYLPSGSTQTTSTEGLYSRYCDIPAGQDGALWSLSKIRVALFTASSDAHLNLENCPNVFALDPAQMMVPAGLDGH